MTAKDSSTETLDLVKDRYAEGARTQVPELCCPVDYDASLLELLPQEIIDRDYGCGDPSRFVSEGETVLDLGAGGGKICYMASQLVGAKGKVIGVDATDEMLALSRKWQDPLAEKIGWHNTEFKHGQIQDLALDRDKLGAWIAEHPVQGLGDMDKLQAEIARLRREEPMIADESVDLVLSNCVLNLVDNAEKDEMFREIHRVLKRGGRCAISDIVCDEDVPAHLQDNPELWSGCISGAMREDRFLDAFAKAGLYGVEIAVYQKEPWAIVEGIEFRSITVVAHKGKEGDCWDHNEAVIYNGPWKTVQDDDGHIFRRGERSAVCHKTFGIMNSAPYAASITSVLPLTEVSSEAAGPFDCAGTRVRQPKETKLGAQRPDIAPGTDCCSTEADCC